MCSSGVAACALRDGKQEIRVTDDGDGGDAGARELESSYIARRSGINHAHISMTWVLGIDVGAV
jgi:hypothetical protein